MISKLKLIITQKKFIILNLLALLLILYFLTSFFYKIIIFVANVPSPYMDKKNQHLDEKLTDAEKKKLIEIKNESKKIRKRIALFSLLLSLVCIFFLREFLFL